MDRERERPGYSGRNLEFLHVGVRVTPRRAGLAQRNAVQAQFVGSGLKAPGAEPHSQHRRGISRAGQGVGEPAGGVAPVQCVAPARPRGFAGEVVVGFGLLLTGGDAIDDVLGVGGCCVQGGELRSTLRPRCSGGPVDGVALVVDPGERLQRDFDRAAVEFGGQFGAERLALQEYDGDTGPGCRHHRGAGEGSLGSGGDVAHAFVRGFEAGDAVGAVAGCQDHGPVGEGDPR